ncbi:hypothetical protein Rsub_01643 [Raphidocelis subcapitata]|uniref:Uncharacterized protein n=1 Tax=Raphidocelis subcapitata TaxID=307507 RepID=A0A2V0NQ79_9CHLO|nr:hypothetical protein Rsub_01643 [Raphidocelis subcapitata]|eukprot:GBF88742.1 hypothetical protein Rsub_01643 [Raphidocelis subcapitata]
MDAHEDAGHGGGGGGGGGGEGSCGALEWLPPLLLDPGPRDPGQQLAPDLQLIDALLRHPGGGGESAPVDADADAARAGDPGAFGDAARAAAMRRAAAALGARHCRVTPALLEALFSGGSGAAATARGDVGSGCVLVAAPHGRLRPRSLREADNLGARSKAKLDDKKARREKKLLRAGFGGRKSGFISPGGGGGGGGGGK